MWARLNFYMELSSHAKYALMLLMMKSVFGIVVKSFCTVVFALPCVRINKYTSLSLTLYLSAALEEQRTQNALHLREQMEAELELMIDRAKNQLLLLQYQRDGAQLQQTVNTSGRKKLYFFHFPFSLSSYFYCATIQSKILCEWKYISLRHMYLYVYMFCFSLAYY